VLQTLTLWSEISTDMFRLWCLAEEDMLRESNGYRWGLGRVLGGGVECGGAGRLWCLAEEDMLRESNGYRWGLGRVLGGGV
jgi:hypothetical protein